MYYPPLSLPLLKYKSYDCGDVTLQIRMAPEIACQSLAFARRIAKKMSLPKSLSTPSLSSQLTLARTPLK